MKRIYLKLLVCAVFLFLFSTMLVFANVKSTDERCIKTSVLQDERMKVDAKESIQDMSYQDCGKLTALSPVVPKPMTILVLSISSGLFFIKR